MIIKCHAELAASGFCSPRDFLRPLGLGFADPSIFKLTERRFSILDLSDVIFNINLNARDGESFCRPRFNRGSWHIVIPDSDPESK